MSSAERIEWRRDARKTRVVGEQAPKDVLVGPGYLYRPNQLVLNTEDLHLVEDQLRRVKAEEHSVLSGAFAEYGLPITVFTVAAVSIPAPVSPLRAGRAEGAPP